VAYLKSEPLDDLVNRFIKSGQDNITENSV